MILQKTGLCTLIVGFSGCFALGGEPVDYDFGMVTIGDVGNPAYPGYLGFLLAGRGSVDYEYRIGRSQITTGQWLEFYNIFGTQSDELASILLPAGWPCRRDLSYDGPGRRYVFVPVELIAEPGLVYAPVSWRQAAMYCNWMHNGQTSDPESLLDGAYDISTFGRIKADDRHFFTDQATHHPDARYWIPTLDEYIKAGNYDPDKNGQGPGWWDFAHSSDDPPIYGMPGIGHVGRDLSDEQISELIGGTGISPDDIPLGIYPDVQSPWGLLDLLGGDREFIEDYEYPGGPRLARYSGNTTFANGNEWDRVWNFQSLSPNSPDGFRIASVAFHPADLNEDTHRNFFDISVFISLFRAGDLRADFNHDGELSFADVEVFLGLMNN